MNDEPITSTRNPRVRAALALRDRRERDRTGLTLVDGARETLRALQAGVTLETVFLCRDLVHGESGAALLERIGEGSHLVEIGRAAHDRLAYGQRGDGVVAVIRPPLRSLGALLPQKDALVAVLAGVEKPGNLGAILRTADGAGLDALLVADAATDLFNPNTIRASLGTVFSLPVVAAPAVEVRAWLRDHGLQAVVARVDGAITYDAVDYRGPTAFVLGSEALGLDASWSGSDVTAVRLPMLGLADSLNVAATAAVLFYEARRQRGLAPPGG